MKFRTLLTLSLGLLLHTDQDTELLFPGHRTLYVGVRMPMDRQSHRHHRAHSSKHRKRERARTGSLAPEAENAENTTSTSHGENTYKHIYANTPPLFEPVSFIFTKCIVTPPLKLTWSHNMDIITRVGMVLHGKKFPGIVKIVLNPTYLYLL